MDIIVRGEPQELDFVRRLCRDKVRRGLLAILPATSPACDEVVRLKNERDETARQLREKDARITELEEHLSSLTVPKTDENVPENTETAENAGENVPETVPNPDSVEDNKTVEVGDMTEVNLDDVKDAPEEDSKAAPAPTPRNHDPKNQSKQC